MEMINQKNQVYNNKQMLFTTKQESHDPLVFVYFNVRGKMQPIRNLCAHLSLPYQEVHLENQDTKRKLPERVKVTLKGLKIEKSSLPLLVSNEDLVYETLPILNYICRKYNAPQLMGRDLIQRARVTEIVELMLTKEPNIVAEFFKMAEGCEKRSNQQITKEKLALYEKCINDSGYIGEICEWLQKRHEGRSFIFGTLTLADFIFLETCHIMLGMFNSINQKKKCALESIFQGLFSSGKKNGNSTRHLKIIQNYVSFIYSQQFYGRNRNHLDSFTMICPSFPAERVRGLRKIWGYNNSFVV